MLQSSIKYALPAKPCLTEVSYAKREHQNQNLSQDDPKEQEYAYVRGTPSASEAYSVSL